MATTDENKTEPKKTAPQAKPAPAGQTNSAPSGQTSKGSDLADALAGAHEARTTVPGAQNVDARLDNRVGDDRPPLETFPAKPQQIDGPDVIHQVEHTRKVLAERNRGDGDDVTRKGMFSPGPHGLSDESLREGETTFGTEGLTTDEAAKGSPKADG